MFNILIGLGFGVGVGSSIYFLIDFFLKRQKIHQIKQEAHRIIKKAQDEEDQKQDQALDRVEEYKQTVLQRHERNKDQILIKTDQLQMKVEKLHQNKTELLSQLEKSQKNKSLDLTEVLKINTKKEEELNVLKDRFIEKKQETKQKLMEKFDIKIEDLKKHLQNIWIDRVKNQTIQQIKDQEEHNKHNINREAHFILELALSRFQYPYCSERGIKNVPFGSSKSMKYLLGEDLSIIKLVEKECGVDMKVNDQDVMVLGIDPVRRELGRAVLQKIADKKRSVKEYEVKKIVKEVKRDLFRKIRSDGQRICKALRLKNVTTEVKNMMGALRYRYSFAQNQHFHCEEVGWLCGLLNAEMGEPLYMARRAGMLHDIGKAMDHSKEGGHATIGAEFIEKHGENKQVVYAVKAHHHDVSPKQPLDFLVISADALSGARPGARRSTVDSYNQKVLTLEKIGKSFKGVKDTYIMSAGREIRVIVDSQQIDDTKALDLSKKIARKIEEECSYPGLIKVTVVRTVTKNIDIQKQAY